MEVYCEISSDLKKISEKMKKFLQDNGRIAEKKHCQKPMTKKMDTRSAGMPVYFNMNAFILMIPSVLVQGNAFWYYVGNRHCNRYIH